MAGALAQMSGEACLVLLIPREVEILAIDDQRAKGTRRASGARSADRVFRARRQFPQGKANMSGSEGVTQCANCVLENRCVFAARPRQKFRQWLADRVHSLR